MSDTRYDRDHAFREDLASLLDEHGFHLENFQLGDKHKPTEKIRTVSIKASRSLDVEQLRLEKS